MFEKHYAPNSVIVPTEAIISLNNRNRNNINNRKTSERRHNSINYLWNEFKIHLGHLQLGHKLCAKYHDPSSSGYSDILFTLSLTTKIPKSKKGHIKSNIHRNLRNVNQVIRIMYPNCMLDIMTLAQAVLQIFCSQGPLWVK